ncbi:MAG: hypothetical protein ACREH8_18180 [Opitutaceae bacterium]
MPSPKPAAAPLVPPMLSSSAPNTSQVAARPRWSRRRCCHAAEARAQHRVKQGPSQHPEEHEDRNRVYTEVEYVIAGDMSAAERVVDRERQVHDRPAHGAASVGGWRHDVPHLAEIANGRVARDRVPSSKKKGTLTLP